MIESRGGWFGWSMVRDRGDLLREVWVRGWPRAVVGQLGGRTKVGAAHGKAGRAIALPWELTQLVHSVWIERAVMGAAMRCGSVSANHKGLAGKAGRWR